MFPPSMGIVVACSQTIKEKRKKKQTPTQYFITQEKAKLEISGPSNI